MRVKDLLHVLGEDRVPLAFDQVLRAVVEVEIALVVHADDVAGPQPAPPIPLQECARGLLRAPPVASHHARSRQHELTDLAGRDEGERFRLDHRRQHVRYGAAERASLGALHGIDVAHGAGLGEPIPLGDAGAGAPRPPLGGGLVQGIGAGEDQLEPPPVHLVGVLVVLEVLEERGHAEEHRGLVTLHGGEDRLGVRTGEEDEQVSLGEAVEHDHDLPVDVEEGQERDHDFLA